MSLYYRLHRYLNYWLDAVDEHSLHSPFFYDFYTKVVKGNQEFTSWKTIEDLREKLLKDNTLLDVTDLGAGSALLKSNQRLIKDIARTSLSPRRYSRLYARIIHYFQKKTIVELGTSLGINTFYLASASPSVVYTFEGASTVANVARANFSLSTTNITLVEGNIDHTLQAELHKLPKIDLAFLDANHRYEPTMRYFEILLSKVHTNTIMIWDDIHYSKEMENAWRAMQKHRLVYGSADLYKCGILFFDPSLNKQHVVLQF
jgi:predicted O-methyltransferase YrrM